jgi:YVTN family beta-propeller protein
MGNSFAARRVLAAIRLVAALALSSAAFAQGPGLGNLTYTTAELFKPISVIHSATAGGSARGDGTVAMHDGYLFVPYGVDSGNPGGGIAFWNVSNPRAPVLVKRVDVNALREPHGFGFSNSYPGHYAVMQSVTGIQFWDFTNVNNPVMLSALTLPGIAASDYDLGAWWCFWQAPYVYVGGSGNGLYIIDATNPSAPVHIKTIPTSVWGSFRVGPVFAVGNLLVMTSMDRSGLVTMDISDPLNPALLDSTSTTPGQYSGIVNGNRIVAAGIDNFLYVYDISTPTQITQVLKSADMGGKGGYVSVQDGFAHSGASNNYAKVNLSTGAVVGKGTSNIATRDEDFGTVLGNLVYIASDHPVGSAIVPHQTAPDTTGPSVNMVSPKNNATNQARTSRVGITLTDAVDLRTVSSTTFIVRPLGGAALAGKYSTQSGIVNFFPSAQLAAATTYEVVVTAGGIKDYVGNGVPAAFTSRFTTAGTAAPLSCTLTTRTAALVSSNVSFAPGSVSGSGTIRYSWDFGDGTVTALSTTSTASHAYAATRHYAVKLTVDNGTTSSTCSTNQTIYAQPTATAPKSSSTIAYDATRNRVWVVNSDTNTVTAIDAAANTKFLEVPVGVSPQTIAQAPDGRLWVANFGSGTVSVLNRDTGALAQTITLPYGSRPWGVAFSPDGVSAYVTLQGTGRLVELNPANGAIGPSLAVGPSPRGIAISGDSNRVFVTRFVSPAARGEITEVNADTFTLTRTFPLALDAGPDTESAGRGVPNYIQSIAIQPDGKRAWIPSKKDNTVRGLFRDGNALTFDSTVRTIVSQIDLVSNAEVIASRIDLNDREMANAVVFSPIGDYAFVSTQGTNLIEVVDAYTRQIVTGLVNVGRAPRGMVITSSGRLFVQNFMSRSVSVYDVSGLLNSTSNTAPKLADIAAVATETLLPQVLAGKLIFYNADDNRMNRDKYISCAGCHLDGGQDGRVMDFTDRGEGLRNTASLLGRRGIGQGRVHWSGNFDEIQDFEHDIRNAFKGTGFMTDAQFNTGTRNQPLGDSKVNVSPDLDALAAYVSSLGNVGPSPFRNSDGSLTSDGAAGQALFTSRGCNVCHSGSDFTDSNGNVLHNVGTIKPSSGQRLGQPLTGLDTPTLRGAWDTAPYLHDGSATTLLDVLTTQNASNLHGNTAGLTTTQLNQIVAYLQQIDDTGAGAVQVPITNLSAKDTASAADWSVRANIQVGDNVYGDRAFYFTSIPNTLRGSAWVRTANDSKSFTGNPAVTFTVGATADVYVAINNLGTRPSWMDGTWTDTGTDLSTRETTAEVRTYSLYRKNFTSGTSVSLGPWNQGSSMYIVIVK